MLITGLIALAVAIASAAATQFLIFWRQQKEQQFERRRQRRRELELVYCDVITHFYKLGQERDKLWMDMQRVGDGQKALAVEALERMEVYKNIYNGDQRYLAQLWFQSTQEIIDKWATVKGAMGLDPELQRRSPSWLTLNHELLMAMRRHLDEVFPESEAPTRDDVTRRFLGRSYQDSAAGPTAEL